jgi:drug/metabolite transporter (DMT)-like permease
MPSILAVTGLLLGIGAGLCWGLEDVTVVWATNHGVNEKWLCAGFHVLATVVLAAAGLATGAFAAVTWRSLLLFVPIGAIGAAAFVVYYTALKIGPISVLSPIISGYAVITWFLAFWIDHERPNVGTAVAVGVTILGVLIASFDLSQWRKDNEGDDGNATRRLKRGVPLALVAMALFGMFVFGVSHDSRQLGWLAPIFLARGIATLFLIPYVAQQRQLRPTGSKRIALISVALLALLDTGGYALFDVGVTHAATTTVSIASSLYAVIPFAVGLLRMKESPPRYRIGGAVLVLVGLGVLAFFQ